MAAEDTMGIEKTVNVDEKKEADEVMYLVMMKVGEQMELEEVASPEKEMNPAEATIFAEVVEQEAAPTMNLTLDGTGRGMYQMARILYLMLSPMDLIL